MSLRVIQPGVLSLLQDEGRFGQHGIGLTVGGPLDGEAFQLCRRLLANPPRSTAIEISFGGLSLEAGIDTFICVTGAKLPLRINGEPHALWQVHPLRAGDRIELGYSQQGCRSYLGVAGGFAVPPVFGSTATVVREGIGGLRGEKLAAGDELPCPAPGHRELLRLPDAWQPRYGEQVELRVIPGYQYDHFTRLQQRRFFSLEWEVGQRSDRMGYRLEGPALTCDLQGILSEGICMGAIQVPADGQPIVLLNDRQTIGGYPKIGSALSLDTARLSQLRPGGRVRFQPITPESAHNALHLARARLAALPLEPAPREGHPHG